MIPFYYTILAYITNLGSLHLKYHIVLLSFLAIISFHLEELLSSKLTSISSRHFVLLWFSPFLTGNNLVYRIQILVGMHTSMHPVNNPILILLWEKLHMTQQCCYFSYIILRENFFVVHLNPRVLMSYLLHKCSNRQQSTWLLNMEEIWCFSSSCHYS